MSCMALTARHASGIKKDAVSQASLGSSILFIPVLAYASHDFSDENKHADLRQTTFGRTSENLPKAAGKWAFLATLESGK